MTGEERVGVCVAGLGMGFSHAAAYSRMQDVDLYICDVNRTRLAEVRERLANVKGIFHDVAQAFRLADVSAVDAALPHNLHCITALEAAAFGKHFMTEKPIARTLEEADTMIEAAEKASTILMVAENQRFMPVLASARQIIDEGYLGKLFLVRVYELTYGEFGDWRTSLAVAGGGNLIDSGIHGVNSMRLLGGSEVRTVYARTTREVHRNLEGEDTAHVCATFENGVLGDLITSWGTRMHGNQPRFSAYGTEGSLWVPWEDRGSLYFTSTRLPGGASPVQVRAAAGDTVEIECRHFVDCIKEGRQPVTSGLEGRRDLEVVLAAYRSAETGVPVRLPLDS